jgi:hypothetical protein
MNGFAQRDFERRGMERLAHETASLARGVPPDVPPDTLFVLTHHGGVQVLAAESRFVTFGRNPLAVDVCVGEHDAGVSRQHGRITFEAGLWRVQNTGRVPIRLRGFQLLLTGHHASLPRAYTPLFIQTDGGREHLVELRVSGVRDAKASGRPDDETCVPHVWPLEEPEKLVLVILGQRYLRHEPNPLPLPWEEVAAQLAEVQPHARWTRRAAAHRVRDVRLRLAAAGVPNLTEKDVPRPVGNTLNHNLLMELLVSTTLVPPDLDLLGDGESWEYRDLP